MVTYKQKYISIFLTISQFHKHIKEIPNNKKIEQSNSKDNNITIQ